MKASSAAFGRSHALPMGLSLTLSLLLLAGCAHEVQVVTVTPAEKCEPAQTLIQACEVPDRLADAITYGQLLDSYEADRQRLRRCAAQHEDLARTLAGCNRAIDLHNAELAAQIKAHPAN